MSVTVKVYLNDGPGRFWEYQPGDRLYPVEQSIVVDAPTAHDVLEAAFAIGNRMDTDADGSAWPPFVRSISAGDVLVAGPSAWAVDPVGFRAIDLLDFLRSTGPDGISRSADGGHDFGPPYRSQAEYDAARAWG